MANDRCADHFPHWSKGSFQFLIGEIVIQIANVETRSGRLFDDATAFSRFAVSLTGRHATLSFFLRRIDETKSDCFDEFLKTGWFRLRTAGATALAISVTAGAVAILG